MPSGAAPKVTQFAHRVARVVRPSWNSADHSKPAIDCRISARGLQEDTYVPQPDES